MIHQQISSLNETVESDNKIVSCIWDPLGKYICWLSLSNNVHIYNLNSKKIETSVSLNLKVDKNELFVSKEERLMDFSPDLAYLLVPSLDDKKMPFVCALKRSNNFQIDYVFAGHFSSITCVKFYPGIFERSQGLTRQRYDLHGLCHGRRLRPDQLLGAGREENERRTADAA